MSIIYEHTSRDSCEAFSVALDDDRTLNIGITPEGIIMDVFRNMPIHDKGAAVPIPKDEYVNEHLGTVGMMFDEWADWVQTRIDPSLKIGESVL